MSGKLLHNPELALQLFGTVPGGAGNEACLRCGGRNLWPEVSLCGEPYGIYCVGCGWVGPRASAPDGDPDEAWFAWNNEARKVRQARDLGLKVNLTQPPVHPDE